MERYERELLPKKPVQFVCDYRPDRPVAALSDNQNLQLPESEQIFSQEPYVKSAETIHVTLDDSELFQTKPIPAEMIHARPPDTREQEMGESVQLLGAEISAQQEQMEGVPLWKRNNGPPRLYYVKKPKQKEKKQHQYEDVARIRPLRLFCGVFVLMAAFAGVVCFCMFGNSIPLVQDSTQLSTFLAPVMMQNPAPFSSITGANNDMILQASVWRAVTLNSRTYKETDDKGRLVVLGVDVEKACADLFGSTCQLAVKQPSDETFFTYDTASDTYRILPQSSVAQQKVQIKNIQKESGVVIVTVETVADDEETSFFRYVLQADALSGEPYLASIERV